MRGAPASGKSYAAKKLAGRQGVVCETDSYFGPPGEEYSFVSKQVPEARASNMRKFMSALLHCITPIVVDRGNGKGDRTRWYVQAALDHGYTVQFAEPVSKQWSNIKKVLIQKAAVDRILEIWAVVLAKKQKRTHGVEQWRILKSLKKFDPELTVEKVLEGE